MRSWLASWNGIYIGLIALALVGFSWSQAQTIDLELQVWAPSQLKPDQPFALRAALLDLSSEDGLPKLTEGQCHAGWPGKSPQRLTQSSTRSFEGSLPKAPNIQGSLPLRVVCQSQAPGSVQVVLPTRVTSDKSAPDTRRPRFANVLQQLALGPLHTELPDSEVPAHFLDVRVRQGACLPEEACEVLVWVGDFAGEVTLDPTASVPESRTHMRGEHVIAFKVITRGVEANTTLIAIDNQGKKIAARALRLPTDLAFPQGIVWRESESGPAIDLSAPGAPKHVLVDVFYGEHWQAAATIEAPMVYPLSTLLQTRLGRSLNNENCRVQLRSDPLSETPTRVWMFDNTTDGKSDLDRAFFNLAPEEATTLALPTPVSSYPTALQNLRMSQRYMRWCACGLILMAGLLLSRRLLARTLTAQAEADMVMGALDKETEGSAPVTLNEAHAPSLPNPWLWTTLLLLALLLALAYVLLAPGQAPAL